MSSETYSMIIEQPLEKIWATVLRPERWLHAVPGYQSSITLEDNHYQVLVHIDLGPMNKQTVLTFHFFSSESETILFFSFRSTNGKVQGEGKIQATAISKQATEMVVQIDLTMKGKSSKLVKPFLPSIKQTWVKEITRNFAASLQE